MRIIFTCFQRFGEKIVQFSYPLLYATPVEQVTWTTEAYDP